MTPPCPRHQAVGDCLLSEQGAGPQVDRRAAALQLGLLAAGGPGVSAGSTLTRTTARSPTSMVSPRLMSLATTRTSWVSLTEVKANEVPSAPAATNAAQTANTQRLRRRRSRGK